MKADLSKRNSSNRKWLLIALMNYCSVPFMQSQVLYSQTLPGSLKNGYDPNQPAIDGEKSEEYCLRRNPNRQFFRNCHRYDPLRSFRCAPKSLPGGNFNPFECPGSLCDGTRLELDPDRCSKQRPRPERFGIMDGPGSAGKQRKCNCLL